MSLNTPTILTWSTRFPLQNVLMTRDKNPVPDRTGGIYMWGFDANYQEIIWYVGESTNIRDRLRTHYFNIMSCQYQLPKGFLKGTFQTLADVTSAWECNRNDPLVVERLRDWTQMHEIFKAGHTFANQAFARIAPINSKSKEELRAIEHAVIYDLQPLVIQKCKVAPNQLKISHVVSPTESGWVQSWRATYKAMVESRIIK